MLKMQVGNMKQNQLISEERKVEERVGYDSDEYEDVSEEEPESNDEVIKIVNVHKTYLLGIEGVPALRGVNVTIREGEFICILGTSGGGKTTLLNIIGTIDKPSKGDIYICGLRIK
jgi:putative ABC transport system ATP-binding protein